MDSSVSPKDEIWFLRVCHHILTGLYDRHICHAKEQTRGCDRTRRPLSSKAKVLSSENLTAINSTRIISITTRTSVLRTLNLHNGAKLFLSLSCFVDVGIFKCVVNLLCEHAFTHTHMHTRTHNAMRADGSNVFFFQANGERPDLHTSLATSRNIIGGVVQHFIQSTVSIMFIFNADDSKVKICPRSERKQPSFPDIYF